jgi:hypothetical protein
VSLDMQYIFKMTKEEKRQAGQQSSSPTSPAANISEGDGMLLIPSANDATTTDGDMASEAGEETAAEPGLSIDTVTEVAPGDGPNDAAITDWHWHSSKWEARAARTTLNDQGGYDGSEDHPGFGTEAGPDFRCATISPGHLTN